MISFLADGLYWPLLWLDFSKQQAEHRISESGSDCQLLQDECETISRQLQLLRPICEQLRLVASQGDIEHLSWLANSGTLPQCSVVIDLIKKLTSSVHSEVNVLQFAFIPVSKVEFFEKHDLFGEAVSAAFPSAQPEIKDAGNCLAADLHTAAVFHLMRAVEHGLRALARHLRVRTGQPLEYACWEHVIRAIDRKLNALRSKPKGKKKSDELEFYGRILMECAYFKDAWRNPVSHARGRYREAQALDVFGHVRDFMQRLAERVKETN
jgi:hypothetical protein